MLPLTSSHDPRTVSRKITGIFEMVFPRLFPGIVAMVNKRATSFENCTAVQEGLIRQATVQKSMLFELALVVGEKQLGESEEPVDWEDCFRLAVSRQRQYYDAAIPIALGEVDRAIAEEVGGNLVSMLTATLDKIGGEIVIGPFIPGFGWISSGVGDYSIGHTLIEVKNRSRPFSTADYRQIVMYWLLSYLRAIEADTETWESGLLLNPRTNSVVEIDFGDFVSLISGGRTAIEAAETFMVLVQQEQR